MLEIVPDIVLDDFLKQVDFEPVKVLEEKLEEVLPVDYFQFYNSVSTVYSSKIEGDNIDYDSYFKHKFLKVKYQPDYTKKADDLFEAYEFAQSNALTEENVMKAHSIMSRNLLPKDQRGRIRNNPMFIINEDDRIEYVAASPDKVHIESAKLFRDIQTLLSRDLSSVEVFYFAAMIHLVFVKVHPLKDGNGRTARLVEKWFLQEKLGEKASAVELEKNYYVNRKMYYDNIRMLGLDYETLNYEHSLAFCLMTVRSLRRGRS
jgi:Fic family protein